MGRMMVATLAALLLAGVTPSHAHRQTRTDPDGTGGRLDIEAIGARHTRRLLTVELLTHERFRDAALGRRGDAYFDLATRRFDGYVWVNFVDGELRGSLWRWTEGDDSEFVRRGLRVERGLRNRTLSAEVPRSVLAASGRAVTVRWWASTWRRGHGWDEAPDEGRLRHWLPAG